MCRPPGIFANASPLSAGGWHLLPPTVNFDDSKCAQKLIERRFQCGIAMGWYMKESECHGFHSVEGQNGKFTIKIRSLRDRNLRYGTYGLLRDDLRTYATVTRGSAEIKRPCFILD